MFVEDKDVLVLVTKADLMYTRMVWRSDDFNDGDTDVIEKKLWDNGEFTTLLAELREADSNMLGQKAKRKDVESSLKTRQRKCMRFVKEGEFKKARQKTLTNTPKWNGNVDEKLKPLFPDRLEHLREEST